MKIDYDHEQNRHTLQGAKAALSALIGTNPPRSLLDVGCGTGNWLRAAADLGVIDIFGVDGIIAQQALHISRDLIERRDLSIPFNLGRRFDLVICLEVAEHLPEASAEMLISSIVSHSDTVLFSAAYPGQAGQNHINSQWPAYWQEHFNRRGFKCDDSARWQIWDDSRIEPWYRQNIFWAHLDRQNAGHESRIKAAIHPEALDVMSGLPVQNLIKRIETGGYPLRWYLTASARSLATAIRRRAPSWLK